MIDQNSSMRIRLNIYWLLLLAYALLIFYLSSIPDVPIPEFFFSQDKWIHLVEYGIFSILSILSIKNTFIRLSIGRVFMTAFILTFLYGISDEIHQYFVPGRFSSIYDILFDGAGAISGILTYKYTRIKNL